MALLCPQFHLTFYAAAYPSEAGAVVLLGQGHWVDETSALNGDFQQVVDEVDYVRGSVPDYWVRGGRRTALEWTRVIPDIPVDGSAVALAMDAIAEVPEVTGWILLELPHLGRQWVIAPCAVASLGWTHRPRSNELHLRWAIKKGIATEIATTAEEGAITTEIGVEILTEDGGNYLALEEAV